MPKSKRQKPNVAPADLAQRLAPRTVMRARALLRECLGRTDDAADVLERLAEVVRMVDETAADDTADEAVSEGTERKRSQATRAKGKTGSRKRPPAART